MIDAQLVIKIKTLLNSISETNKELFEALEIIETLVEQNRTEYLPWFFSFIEDNPDLIDVQDSIIIAIEDYPNNAHIIYLLKNLKSEFYRIPECCDVLISRLLNTESDKAFLKQNIHLADKETMLKLLDNMENDKYCPEQHKPIIKELREMVNNRC